MKIIKMHVDHHAPFHFGDASGHLAKTFSSDQLFSTLTNNIRLLYGPEKIQEFVSIVANGELVFSSLFIGLDIYERKEKRSVKTIYFLPRPNIDFYFINETYRSFKEFKKIEYVSFELFQKLSECWSQEKEAVAIDADTVQIVSGQFALLKEEVMDLEISANEWESLSIFSVHVRPGVKVNRLNSVSENYFSQEDMVVRYQYTKQFVLKPFFYFFLDGELPSFISAAIYLIADEGIGGRRSSGRGMLKQIEIVENNETFPNSGKYWMSLSSHFPKKEEVHALYSYELEKRNGYIYTNSGTTFRKKSILVVKEGSLFTEKVEGQILDIKPDRFEKHSVYFYGKPMLVGFGGALRE